MNATTIAPAARIGTGAQCVDHSEKAANSATTRYASRVGVKP